MTLIELLALLNDRDLRLRRDGDQIAVVGDGAKLTPDVVAGLKDHKADLLDLLPEPKPRLLWWSDELSDSDNEAVDDFMGYDPDGPSDTKAQLATLLAVVPCPKCGSLWAWFNSWGDQRCRTCDPPLNSIRLAEKAAQLRGQPCC